MPRKDADRKGGCPRYGLGVFTCWDGMLSMTVRVFREAAFEV